MFVCKRCCFLLAQLELPAWDRTLSHDPLGQDADCIRIPDAHVSGGATYHVVASDDNDFNAVLPSLVSPTPPHVGPGRGYTSA